MMHRFSKMRQLLGGESLGASVVNAGPIAPVEPEPPPVPPSFNVAAISASGNGYAVVGSRQVALEVSGAYSLEFMIRPVNLGVGAQRVLGVSLTGAGDQQWGFFLRSQIENNPLNQHLQCSIFTDGTNFITIQSSKRLLKSRWTHVVMTDDGSGTQGGLNFYFNAVPDSAAIKTETGNYTTPYSSASLRMQLSSQPSSTQRFRGNITRLRKWSGVLTQSQINELFNNGEPFDASGVSFYGSIIADWPLDTDGVCDTNAAFNFTTLSNVSFGSRPVSCLYPSWTGQNARIGNTKYLAFGTGFARSLGLVGWIGDGESHVVNTVGSRYYFDPSNLLAAAPVSWVDDVCNLLPDGIRGCQVGEVGGDILNFTSAYDDVGLQFGNVGFFRSTDGLTGEAFGAFNIMEPPVAGWSNNFYGPVIDGMTPGQKLVAFHEYKQDLSVQHISIFESTDNFATWTKHLAFSGGASDGFNEPCILKTSLGIVMLVREQAGARISCSVSADGLTGWTTPVDSTLATGTGMASMCLDDDGNIVVFYADRGDGFGKISLGNVVADIFADRSDWNAGSSVFQTADGTSNLLGYPVIANMGNGIYAGGISTEVNPPSATRTDFFVFYGAFGAG